MRARTTAFSAENWTSTMRPKRLLLLLRVVLALPKAWLAARVRVRA